MQTKWRAKVEFLVPPEEISDISIQRLNKLLDILAEYYPDAKPLTDLGIGTRQKTEILVKSEQLVIEAI